MPSHAFFMMLFGGIWSVAGGILSGILLLASAPPWDDWILDSRSVRVSAQPARVEATGTRVNKRRLYEVHLRFKDKRGREQRGTATTNDDALLTAAHAGRPIPIEYDPESPDRLRFAGQSASFFGVFALVPVFFTLVAAGLLARGLLSTRRTRRLYREGDLAEGRVTDITLTMVSRNRRRVKLMHYVFTSPTGPVDGSWKTLSPAPVGSSLWVIYDRERPGENLPAEL